MALALYGRGYRTEDGPRDLSDRAVNPASRLAAVPRDPVLVAKDVCVGEDPYAAHTSLAVLKRRTALQCSAIIDSPRRQLGDSRVPPTYAAPSSFDPRISDRPSQ